MRDDANTQTAQGAEFHRKDKCDRCNQPMTAQIMSFFTEEMICMNCLQRERELIQSLRQRGLNPFTLVERGEIPHLHTAPP